MILARLIEAFIVHVNDEGGAAVYLANIGLPLNRSKDMVYITTVRIINATLFYAQRLSIKFQIFLGDCILVWRCYMVWNRDWRVAALPSVMVVATGGKSL